MYCTICGRTDKECKIRKIKDMTLCPKHITQYYRYGDFLQKTIYDKNDIIIHEDYAEIILRNKQQEITGKAIIDKEDIELCKKYKWHLRTSCGNNYAVASVNNTKIHLHRLVLNYNGTDEVDHIDHNGLNNQKKNLRIVSHSDNLRNQKNNRKGIKKVGSGRYQALITKNYQGIYLGTYDTYEEAMAARQRAEIELSNN